MSRKRLFYKKAIEGLTVIGLAVMLIVLLLCAASLTGCADLSNDTTIYPPKGSVDFAAADADGNGTISPEEWRAYQARE